MPLKNPSKRENNIYYFITNNFWIPAISFQGFFFVEDRGASEETAKVAGMVTMVWSTQEFSGVVLVG